MLRHFDGGVVIRRDEVAEIAQAFGDDVEDRTMGGERDVLGQPRDAHAWLHPDAAAIGLEFAADDLQQRRLAGAVAADHADAFFRVDLQVRAVEQRQVSVSHRDVVERDQGHMKRAKS